MDEAHAQGVRSVTRPYFRRALLASAIGAIALLLFFVKRDRPPPSVPPRVPQQPTVTSAQISGPGVVPIPPIQLRPETPPIKSLSKEEVAALQSGAALPPLLRESDRGIGFAPPDVAAMARDQIHLHIALDRTRALRGLPVNATAEILSTRSPHPTFDLKGVWFFLRQEGGAWKRIRRDEKPNGFRSNAPLLTRFTLRIHYALINDSLDDYGDPIAGTSPSYRGSYPLWSTSGRYEVAAKTIVRLPDRPLSKYATEAVELESNVVDLDVVDPAEADKPALEALLASGIFKDWKDRTEEIDWREKSRALEKDHPDWNRESSELKAAERRLEDERVTARMAAFDQFLADYGRSAYAPYLMLERALADPRWHGVSEYMYRRDVNPGDCDLLSSPEDHTLLMRLETEFPNFDQLDRVLYLLAAYEHDHGTEEQATQHLRKLEILAPDSAWSDRARRIMADRPQGGSRDGFHYRARPVDRD
jgi:hypothetical protein